jgi:hypothetical protein
MRRRDKEKGGSGTEIAPLPNTYKIKSIKVNLNSSFLD